MSTGSEATLIDTSCWIEAMREGGDAAVRGRVHELLESGRARLTEIVRLELWNGLGGEDQRRFLREVEDLVETAPTTQEVWSEARSLADRARRRGITVPAADLLIFAAARVHGLTLMHRDTHFDRLDGLV